MIAMLPLAVAAAIGGGHPPARIPAAAGAIATPIGVAPGFRLPAAGLRAMAGRPIAGLACAPRAAPAGAAHVELFARGQVLLLPPGIGVASPAARVGARIAPHGCVYPLRTLDPTGVVWLGRPRGLTLGMLFALWGQPLGVHRLAGFRSRSVVRAYVGGVRWRGPLSRLPLTDHAEVVVEIGPYVPPHRSFGFSGRVVT
jgi:hypothetical protein